MKLALAMILLAVADATESLANWLTATADRWIAEHAHRGIR